MVASPIEEIIPLMEETCRFFELGLPDEVADMSPICKSVVSRFKTHYYTRVNNPEQLAKDLVQVLAQCESTERSTLVSPDNKSVKKLVETKSKFDHSLERLLHKLSELNLNMVSSAVNNLTRIERRKIGEYFACLQMELSRKITDLVKFQTQINGHCN